MIRAVVKDFPVAAWRQHGMTQRQGNHFGGCCHEADKQR